MYVRQMLNESRESLSSILGMEVRESEFNDDQLGRVLWALGQPGQAEQTLRYISL